MERKPLVIDVKTNGDVSFIDKPELDSLKSLGESKAKRISHVEPVSWPLRIVFHIIRGLVRDDSRLANWTRNWSCLWRARMFKTGKILGPFEDRTKAIEAEVEYWNEVESKS